VIRQTGAPNGYHPYHRATAYDPNEQRGSNVSLRSYRRGPPPSPHHQGPRRGSYAGFTEGRVALPPLSTIERVADSYAPSKLSPTRRLFRQSEPFEPPSEAEVRERRATLMQGRRWILDMLEDTDAMLRHLDNASRGPTMNNAKLVAGQIH
jgi:hypothetical protein